MDFQSIGDHVTSHTLPSYCSSISSWFYINLGSSSVGYNDGRKNCDDIHDGCLIMLLYIPPGSGTTLKHTGSGLVSALQSFGVPRCSGM